MKSRTVPLLLLLTAPAHADGVPNRHVFQSQRGAQLFVSLSRPLLSTDQLYLQAGNHAPQLLFDAHRYGNSAVLLNATFGSRNTVYVLANLPKQGTTILDIDTRTRRVTRQFALSRMQIENVSPTTFTYDPSHDTLTLDGDRGYTIRRGNPDANSAHFYIGPMHKRQISIQRQTPF